jgi:hypothetical protein
MFKVARAAVLLGISCVGTYELLSTSLFPQWGCRDLKEVTDQDKYLKARTTRASDRSTAWVVRQLY